MEARDQLERDRQEYSDRRKQDIKIGISSDLMHNGSLVLQLKLQFDDSVRLENAPGAVILRSTE